MLVRNHIGAAPTRVLQPQASNVRVQIWAVAPITDRQTELGSNIYIAHTRERCNQAQGVPLPTSHPIEVDLNLGQELWAISSDTAFLSISVLSR